MRPTLFLIASIVLALPAQVAAQVPSGTHLYATGVDWRPPVTPGCGGLFLIGPLHPTPTRITGLPPDVTGCGTGLSLNNGTSYAIEDPATGDVFVKGSLENAPVNVYRVRIHAPSGSARVIGSPYVIGQRALQAGHRHAVPMPDGRLLLLMNPTNLLPPGLFTGTGAAVLGILDPRLPANAPQVSVPVTPIPTGGPTGLAVTANGSQAMITYTNAAGNTTAMYSVDLPIGGAPALRATVNFGANTLLREPEGTYLIGGVDLQGQTDALARVDLVANTVVRFPQFTSACGFIGGLGIDPVTNDLLIARGCLNAPTSNTSSVYRLPGRSTTSALLLVSNGPPGGWGSVFGGFMTTAALHDYGRASGTPADTRWVLAPNTAGAPVAGNLGFQVQTTRPPGALAGIAFVDPSLGNVAPWGPDGLIVWLGGTVMVNLPTTQTGATTTVGLGIPANASLSGVVLYLQMIHVDAAWRLSGSPGLKVRVQ